MARDIFFIADTHFGHDNILKFDPPRPFSSIEEHDEHIIENWNRVVKPNDKIYHLGDITFKRSCMKYFDRLNGIKRLVLGNHDLFQMHYYTEHFQKIYGVKHIHINATEDADAFRCAVTHVPIHSNSIERWGLNIHGHLHFNSIPDPRYFCVSVEQINYTPISLEEIKDKLKL